MILLLYSQYGSYCFSADPSDPMAVTAGFIPARCCQSQIPVRNLAINSCVRRSRGVSVSSAAVSVSANQNESSHKLELSFAVGTRVIPHPEKVAKGGEDALYVNNFNGGVLAVADGVSGWVEEDIDPAIFARELVANVSSAIDDDEINREPELLMQRAHEATHSIGSATLIIAMLDKNGVLKIANVGDCGLRVLRNDNVIFSTSTQEHYFDCPFQLSSESSGQTYKDALLYNIEVKEGDVVVMGSDGLFDNVFDHEIERIVGSFEHAGPQDAQKIVDVLVDLASLHASDPTFESPYCLEARVQGYDVPFWRKLFGEKFTGGKLDDITVIVGIVVNNLLLPERAGHVDLMSDFSMRSLSIREKDYDSEYDNVSPVSLS